MRPGKSVLPVRMRKGRESMKIVFIQRVAGSGIPRLFEIINDVTQMARTSRLLIAGLRENTPEADFMRIRFHCLSIGVRTYIQFMNTAEFIACLMCVRSRRNRKNAICVPRLVLASLLCLVPFTVRAQDAIVKAEELIRLQWIPLSRQVSFEQHYPDEAIDYMAWRTLRMLDASSAWNPNNRAWNIYRVNIRYDTELTLRRRWQSGSGTIRSLAENPDTSLAKFYTDAITIEELEKILTFYRGAVGKKYLQYLTEIRRVYYRGNLEFDRISIDPAYGSVDDTATDRRRAWLQQKGISLDPPPRDYDFHIKAAQGIFAGADAANLVFALLAGAPPGSEA
jgi:hypothetical protein